MNIQWKWRNYILRAQTKSSAIDAYKNMQADVPRGHQIPILYKDVKPQTIFLKHKYSKEEKEVYVSRTDNNNIYINWPMNGDYKISLIYPPKGKKNDYPLGVLRSAPFWEVMPDLETVRNWFYGERELTDEEAGSKKAQG